MNKKKPRQVTEKEWELIEAIRNLRKSRHSDTTEFELFVDSLYESLKERDGSND